MGGNQPESAIVSKYTNSGRSIRAVFALNLSAKAQISENSTVLEW